MKWKLIEVTLPRMEDKPMSLNTQREQGPLIKLKGSLITQEHRRITHTKIQEIKLLYFLDEGVTTSLEAPSRRITRNMSRGESSILSHLSLFCITLV